MRILLLGEYSRLHNSLKEGLTALGHEVILLGNEKHIKNRKALSLFETGLKKINTKEYESAKGFLPKLIKSSLTILLF